MWSPEYYALRDTQRILQLIRAHPFGVLSTLDANGSMNAVHLPFMIEELADGSHQLIAHLARANPLHGSFDGRREALVVFSGAHGYISPLHYASSGQVPTWNYSAVHITGRPRIVTGKADSLAIIERLVSAMEPAGSGWRMDTLDNAKREGLLRGIVAFEMPVERMQGKLKLNQNKSAEDVQAVATRQRELGNSELADLMLEELSRRDDPQSGS